MPKTDYDGPGRAISNPAEAQDVVNNYLCADCWGELVEFIRQRPDRTTYSVVHCVTPDCPCSGFVSRKWVERREAESASEALTVRRNLQQAGVLPRPPKKAPAQILTELGF